MLVVIAEEKTESVVVVDMKNDGTAERTADVFKRRYVYLGNVLPVYPLYLREYPLFRAFVFTHVRVTV